MKYWKTLLPVAASLVLAGQAYAQDDEERLRDMEAREAQYAERMREAEERLAEAAQRVAELSSERLGALGESRRFAFEFSNSPRMGVNIEPMGDGSPVEGVSILSVTPGSAADDAGLRAGDIITAVNGETFSASSAGEAAEQLLDFMNGVEEGDVLDVEYMRDGSMGSVEVEPRVMSANAWFMGPDGNFEFPAMPEVHVAPNGAQAFSFSFGGGWRSGWGDMEVVELTEGLGRYFGTDEGLLVIRAPESNAFQLMDGDVIISIDGREPSSVNHCMRILGSYQPGENLVLNIMRDQNPLTIEIEMPDDRTSRLAPPAPVRPAAAPIPPRAPEPADRT